MSLSSHPCFLESMYICLHVCLATCACACLCVCVCMCVLDCVVVNSENAQTVYKVHKLMYCAVVHECQIIFDSIHIHVHFNHLCSFLPMTCVPKFVDEITQN